MHPDETFFQIVRDWLWAPAMGLIAWAWNRNEKEHDAMRAVAEQVRQNTSNGYSALNDRVMDHIDKQVGDVRQFVIQEDTKLMTELSVQRGHIGKVFDKMEAHAQRSEDRHIETMNAIHALATTMHTALAQKADK